MLHTSSIKLRLVGMTVDYGKCSEVYLSQFVIKRMDHISAFVNCIRINGVTPPFAVVIG